MAIIVIIAIVALAFVGGVTEIWQEAKVSGRWRQSAAGEFGRHSGSADQAEAAAAGLRRIRRASATAYLSRLSLSDEKEVRASEQLDVWVQL